MKIRGPKMENPKVSGGPIFSQNFHDVFFGFWGLWGGPQEKTDQKAKLAVDQVESWVKKGV